MTYDEFVSSVETGMRDLLEKEVCIKTHKVLKNNDVELDALTILTENSNISPTIYLNSYYEEYLAKDNLEDIIREIYALYEEYKNHINFDVDIFKNFDNIRDKVVFKLVNTKANKKMLKDIPHIPFLDLSIVFYCIVDSDYLGSATVLIHNIHINMWGITKEELYNVAKINTPKKMMYELKTMSDLIRDVLVGDIKKVICENDDRYDKNCNIPNPEDVADGLMREIDEIKSKISMYVLTNKQRTNGAACILYDDIIKNFAEELKEDLYIVPSSVHEVIIIPAIKEIDTDELNEMIHEVNQNELDEVDVLSDHAYYYSRETGKITV